LATLRTWREAKPGQVYWSPVRKQFRRKEPYMILQKRKGRLKYMWVGMKPEPNRRVPGYKGGIGAKVPEGHIVDPRRKIMYVFKDVPWTPHPKKKGWQMQEIPTPPFWVAQYVGMIRKELHVGRRPEPNTPAPGYKWGIGAKIPVEWEHPFKKVTVEVQNL